MARARPYTIAGVGAALLVAGCATLGVRSAWRTFAWVHPAHKPVPAEDREAARAALPTLEDVSFRTKDGITLRGWYVPSRSRAAVILVHGGFDNRTHWMPDIRALADHAYGVLAYDSRGSGESEGDLVTAGDREQGDLAAAIDFVSARPDVDPSRIGVVGFSFGASTVAVEVARDRRVHAVLLEALWPSLEDETRTKNTKWGPLSLVPALWAMRHEGINLDNVRPVDHIGEIGPRPLLVITGSEDLDTPVPIMERTFAAARDPKTMWIVPGAHHGDYAKVAPEEYRRRVVAFFDGALGN